MNKIALLAASLIVLNVAAEEECACEEAANPFEGVSVYADLGGSWGKVDKTDVKLNGFAADLGAVYRYNCGNDWLVGAGADVTFGNKKKEYSRKITVAGSSNADGTQLTADDTRAVMKTAASFADYYNGANKLVADNITATTHAFAAGRDDTLELKAKFKKLVATPSAYVAFGKSFNNFLFEILAGGAYTGFKFDSEMKTNIGDAGSKVTTTYTSSVKVRKFVPMVGLRLAYAVSDHVSVNLTGKYLANAKKHGIKYKNNYSIAAGIAYKF